MIVLTICWHIDLAYETKEAWRASDVLKEHVEEIREECKSKIDGLQEEIGLLKWMMAQTIVVNDKTKNIEREPEGSVGESYAIEDQNDTDDEVERIEQEMRSAKEHRPTGMKTVRTRQGYDDTGVGVEISFCFIGSVFKYL